MNKVCVFGMWHLGSVTASCLANLGFQVHCLDFDNKIIENFKNGKPPIHEPGMVELFEKNSLSISFHNTAESALEECDYLWITFDISIDEQDEANIEKFISDVVNIFNYIPDQCKIIISSQVKLGTVHILEEIFASNYPEKKVYFSYLPENLRLGDAINNFNHPGRIVVGVRDYSYQQIFYPLLSTITDNIYWVKTESAEMVKHTINSFLASCIVFANEIANICELNNIDYDEVWLGLVSENRIGTTLPLKAGLGFAGGTLARDVNYLNKYSENNYLINSLIISNNKHNEWIKEKCSHYVNNTSNVGVIGLAYKPNTDTLRRSLALNLCFWLKDKIKNIFAYDDNINEDTLFDFIKINKVSSNLIEQCDCIFVFSKKLDLKANFKNKTIIDPNGLYADFFNNKTECTYIKVGKNGN